MPTNTFDNILTLNPANYIVGGTNTFLIGNVPNCEGISASPSNSNLYATVTVVSSPLPVELASFNVKAVSEKVFLSWRTASELNNQGFDIERSSNGKNWQTLGFVPGHGTTQEEQFYSFKDEHPLPGSNYYRLRQVDLDGKFEYSDIRSVMLRGSTDGLEIYPNPVSSGQLNVNFAEEPQGAATLRIFDASGKLLYQEQLTNQLNQAYYGNLSGGIYFIEVTSGQDVWRERLLVK